ncbi:MAG: DUF3025 domain-containing protein [Paraglaciecola sp.]|nr:DUF3025 domain-containing protein [Paraglaciecola sp.]NCT48015.1 DUF3025 domain-containing protein [Paraglaciecola sp.]
MTATWHQPYLNRLQHAPFQSLEDLFVLSTLSEWPNAAGLNQLRRQWGDEKHCPEFICQSEVNDESVYYEQYIAAYQQIPTRPNSWHDLFNALIWLQFPQTKQVLNQQHVADITAFGLHPRTKRRNRLTHFDECGVILTIEQGSQGPFSQLCENLQRHQWHEVFVNQRGHWGHGIQAFIFGHANLESLLQPFIGLTGKWLAIEVAANFSQLTQRQQLHEVDSRLASQLEQDNLLAKDSALFPMPLLGIPGFWPANNQPEFYQNTAYFRPPRVT